MALETVGVRLVAEDGAQYLATMKAGDKALADFGANAVASAQKITTLSGKIDLQKRSLDVLQQELTQTTAKYGEGSVQAQKKQIAIDKLTASINKDEAELEQLQKAEHAAAGASKQFEDGIDGAGKAGKKFGEVMTGALREVGAFAVRGLVAAGQAFVGFVKDSLDQVGDYEQSMNMFGAVTGASADEMKRAGALAKSLGGDLSLPATSAADAGKAMTELAKAGLSVNDVMGAAKGTLQLAAAGGLDEAQAAEIAANALNTFRLSGDKAVEVADLLAAAANASSIEVTDAAAALKQAGSVYSSFQGPVVGAKDALIDMTTAIAILGNAGIKGSDAGTSLKQSLLQLAAPSDKAKGLMVDLADSIGVSGDIAFDASGNMRSLKDIVGLVAKSTAHMTQEERNYNIATIFGADATRAIIALMDQGADGWDKMRKSVTKEGAAADLAATRMQGMKGALAGVQSQAETLMLEALEPLLPIITDILKSAGEFAGSLVGKVGPAVTSTIGVLKEIGAFISTILMPAINGLAVATIAYALTTLPGLIAALTASTGAFIAQAGAVAIAAAPLVAIALAVAAVTLKYQEFNDKVTTATDTLLNSRQFWTDSSAALDTYAAASDATKEKVAGLAASIEEQRTALHNNIDSLGKRMAAGIVSEAQYKTEMEAINAQAGSIKTATGMLNDQVSTYEHLHDSDALEDMRSLRSSHEEYTQTVQLSKDEIDAWEKKLEAAYTEGSKAVSGYVQAATKYHADLQKAIEKGSKEELDKVSADYAAQAAAARASIGDQLTTYTTGQLSLGNISRDQAKVILGEIEKEFGTTKDISGKTFLEMEQAIDDFAHKGGQSADDLGGKLDDLTDTAVTTKEKMDALATKYEATLVQNFLDGKIDAEELRKELEKIPSRVYSDVYITVHRNTVNTESGGGEGSGSGAGPNRPSMNSMIVAPPVTPPMSPSQIMAAGSSTSTYNNQRSVNLNYHTTYAPPASQSMALASALAG